MDNNHHQDTQLKDIQHKDINHHKELIHLLKELIHLHKVNTHHHKDNTHLHKDSIHLQDIQLQPTVNQPKDIHKDHLPRIQFNSLHNTDEV